MTADLRAIAATSLRHLTAGMRLAASLPSAPTTGDDPHAITRESYRRMLAESRREAVADLERLRDSLLVGDAARGEARAQAVAIDSDALHALSAPTTIDAWATAWEASP